jgi:hypothetical protein
VVASLAGLPHRSACSRKIRGRPRTSSARSPIIAYVGKKLNYDRTEYRFYPDRLEFDEGFLTVNKKVIMFRDVKETSLRKGILQRIYGLGSIYLATLATGSTGTANPFVTLGFGNVSASGIIVRDISDPDGTFEKVRQLVDAQTG